MEGRCNSKWRGGDTGVRGKTKRTEEGGWGQSRKGEVGMKEVRT